MATPAPPLLYTNNMGPRWTVVQVVLLGMVSSILAQNFATNSFQSPSASQPLTSSQFLPSQQFSLQTQPQRFLPQNQQFQQPQLPQTQLSDEQSDALRIQQEFRKSVAEANKVSPRTRKPVQNQFFDQSLPQAQTLSLPVQGVRSVGQSAPVQTVQVQTTPLTSQGFQNVPQQHVRSQPTVRHHVRQQQRQQLRQPVQQFSQPQPTIQQPSAVRQQFNQQQFQPLPQTQPTVRQQFDQQDNFQLPQQSFESPQLEPVVAPVRRPFQGSVVVRRPQEPEDVSFRGLQQEPAVVSVRRPQQHRIRSEFDEDEAKQQAENAKYSFSSAVTDSINDNQHLREEVRDGLNLKGLYSYSDGFFKRTVHYEADENGYRIVKEEVDPIGDGPQGDPNGRADVSSSIGGANLQYSVTSADLQPRPLQVQQAF